MRVPEYTLSLLFFVLPIIAILAFFAHHKLLGFTQRRALFLNVAVLALVGCLLDLFFAKWFFTFPDPTRTLGLEIRGIPVEEFVFYVTGFWFILLLYVFGDEHFLRRYNHPDSKYARYAKRLKRKLYLSLSPRLAIHLLVVIGVLAWVKHRLNPGHWLIPGYVTFLLLVAYAPFFLFWRLTRKWVNFQSLTVTIIVTTLISIIWEVTLALPRGYWGYQQDPMLGVFLPAWNFLPIEAVSVWIFSSLIVLSYEFTKIAYFRKHHARYNLNRDQHQ